MYFWMADCSPVCSFGDGNPTELDLGYVQINYKLNTVLYIIWNTYMLSRRMGRCGLTMCLSVYR